MKKVYKIEIIRNKNTPDEYLTHVKVRAINVSTAKRICKNYTHCLIQDMKIIDTVDIFSKAIND